MNRLTLFLIRLKDKVIIDPANGWTLTEEVGVYCLETKQWIGYYDNLKTIDKRVIELLTNA